jgi:hypothetical protein
VLARNSFGARVDIIVWSFMSIFTGLGAVLVLLFLTGVLELACYWLRPGTRQNTGTWAKSA